MALCNIPIKKKGRNGQKKREATKEKAAKEKGE